MSLRMATPEDAADLARLHVAAWAETYADLLPAEVIARYDLMFRFRQWSTTLQTGRGRVALVPEAGFASAGPQRDEALAQAGFPGELYAIYLLKAAQGRGLGRALMRAVVGSQPFSTVVVEGNARACGFYEHAGGRVMEVRKDQNRERVYVWDKGLPATFL